MQKDGAAVSFKLAAAPSFPFCLGDAALSLIVTGHAAFAEVDDIGVVVLPVDHQGVIVLIHRGGFKEKDRRAFVELQRRGDFAGGSDGENIDDVEGNIREVEMLLQNVKNTGLIQWV